RPGAHGWCSRPEGGCMSAEQWALVLGASSGTGAAIAVEMARSRGLNVFGVHRGRYLEQAEQVEREVAATGRRIVMHRGDAGTPDGAAQGAEALLALAGPRSVKLFVHSIASGSLGRFVSGEKDQL